jgi:uncharacterized FlaG/YvyC family protein
MASGIDNLASAVARSVALPVGPAARPSAPGRERTQRSEASAEAVGRSTPEKGSGKADWEEVAQARKETLAALLEYAQRAALASDTTIYYQKDDKNGRMYLHVTDKETGKELYRIPKDLFTMSSVETTQSHQLDVQV